VTEQSISYDKDDNRSLHELCFNIFLIQFSNLNSHVDVHDCALRLSRLTLCSNCPYKEFENFNCNFSEYILL
jgi:hypothetical protein